MARRDKETRGFPAITKGATIGIIAPSSPSQAERLKKGVNYLESLGFRAKVVLDPALAYGGTKFLFSSDTAEARARALEALFKDPEIKAVLATRGGYGCQELLPLLDFTLLGKNPKPFIGASDITALLVTVYQRAGIVTIHGPVLESTFSKAVDNPQAHTSAAALIELLSGTLENPFSAVQLNLLCGKGTQVKGRLIGGNLSVIASLSGTPWQPVLRSHILFLEEVDEKPYRLHRMLLQMKYAGMFEGLSGVVLGSFRNCVHEKGIGPAPDQVLTEIFTSVGVSLYRALPFGHEDLNLPIPLGVLAQIRDNKLEFLESAVLK